MPCQSFFKYNTDYAQPILLLIWHRLSPANPSFNMTPTKSRQSFFLYDTDYAPPNFF